MTRLEIHLDAETLQPIIQATVETAIRRLQAERATTEPDRILVDKPGAGDVLSVSVSTIDRWRREEGLPFVKLNGLVMFRPEALREWAAEKEKTNST
jgi:hypothetical protein